MSRFSSQPPPALAAPWPLPRSRPTSSPFFY
jgi:hypothetical protein